MYHLLCPEANAENPDTAALHLSKIVSFLSRSLEGDFDLDRDQLTGLSLILEAIANSLTDLSSAVASTSRAARKLGFSDGQAAVLKLLKLASTEMHDRISAELPLPELHLPDDQKGDYPRFAKDAEPQRSTGPKKRRA